MLARFQLYCACVSVPNRALWGVLLRRNNSTYLKNTLIKSEFDKKIGDPI